MKTYYQLLAFFLVYYPSYFSQNYYVSFTNGDNNNPGTLVLPFKTIQRAVNSATAGSTVFVREGNITAITNSGTLTNPLRIL